MSIAPLLVTSGGPLTPEQAAIDDADDLDVLRSDSELATMFISEALDHLSTIEATVLQLESDPTDQKLLNDVFRPFHTVKGNAGALSVKSVQEFAHKVEEPARSRARRLADDRPRGNRADSRVRRHADGHDQRAQRSPGGPALGRIAGGERAVLAAQIERVTSFGAAHASAVARHRAGHAVEVFVFVILVNVVIRAVHAGHDAAAVSARRASGRGRAAGIDAPARRRAAAAAVAMPKAAAAAPARPPQRAARTTG